ncbi:MAG: endonuclease/exonuclease/phosphatase family protein [Candidatus Hydrogenedentes bacterium]|nr:endonuclease/exonuclease/phosphatase family protein [Candidatus Hydrogenedentota bacterium]
MNTPSRVFYRFVFAALALFVIAWCVAATAHASDVRVLSFNVKVDFEVDESCPPWDERKDLCAQVVKEARADLVGFQETSPNQLAFFQEVLPDFETVGALALTPEEVNWFQTAFPPLKAIGFTTYTDSILMYRRDRFEKLEEGHWWHSPTPEKVSTGFGNVFPRIAVWAKLRDKATKRAFVAVVTHFDATSPAQEGMAALSREKLRPFLDAGLPVVFWGDYNADSKDAAYATLTESPWRDAYAASPLAGPGAKDSNVTTSGWDIRIDHILYAGAGLEATEWRRIESPKAGVNLSDHYPVFAVLQFGAAP